MPPRKRTFLEAFRRSLVAPLLAVAPLWFSTASMGATVAVDTVISPGSALDGERLTVVRGTDRTEVTLLEDASALGFSLKDDSLFTVAGGDVTYISLLEDDATFVMAGGSVACSDLSCSGADIDAMVTATDNAKVELFGGVIEGYVRIQDQSTLTVRGSNLRLFESLGDIVIQGSFFDGTPISLGVRITADVRQRIFLVPEPGTLAPLLTGFGCSRIIRGAIV